MRMAHPEFLLLLALIPLFILVSWLLGRARRNALARLLPAAEQQQALNTAQPARDKIKVALMSVALLFLTIAAARPQLGFDYVEMQRRGVDVVLAIDVSLSMLARDVVPDRLGRAKHAADRLIDRLGGDRVAVLPFAGSSALRWPLSFDHGAAKMLIDALDASAVPRAGTGMKNAVEGALKLFTKDERYEKVLVIFSDGEDLVGGVEEAGKLAQENGLLIHTVAIGEGQGVPIPLPGDSQETFKRDRKGQVVLTRMEAEPLQILSALSGGIFLKASYTEEEVDKVADRIKAMTGRDLKKAMAVRYKEQYQWFLIPAVVLLGLEALTGRRRRMRK